MEEKYISGFYGNINPLRGGDYKLVFSQSTLDALTAQAKASPRLRMNLDLRNSPEDGSQRMLNAIEPGSLLPIHRHRQSSETVVCLRGLEGTGVFLLLRLKNRFVYDSKRFFKGLWEGLKFLFLTPSWGSKRRREQQAYEERLDDAMGR